ncbi:MAG TPA: hypothetical protein VM389_01760 [Phycisphaerae bacterium]|nr:hypothetical protein [Phycisphaerae bacterium]
MIGIPPGTYTVVCHPRGMGQPLLEITGVAIEAGKTLVRDLSLEQRFILTGKITYANGKLAAGMAVDIACVDRQRNGEFHDTTKTDAHGRFEIGTPLRTVTYVGINGGRTDGRMPLLAPGLNVQDYVLRLRRGRHVAAPAPARDSAPVKTAPPATPSAPGPAPTGASPKGAGVARRGSPRTQPGDKSAFGPVAERIVRINSLQDGCVDLDAAKVLSYPKGAPRDEASTVAWDRRNGVDVSVGAASRHTGLHCFLLCRDMIAGPVDPRVWDAAPAVIATEAEKARWLSRGGHLIETLPATFVFKTREGGVGLLQVLEATKSPGGYLRKARIAFKLLKGPPPKVNPEDIAWGEAVGGLQCAVRPAQESFAPGEDLSLEIVYRNVSDRPITVCVYPDPLYVWTMLQVREDPHWPGGNDRRGQHGSGARLPLKLSDFVTLDPGETAAVPQVIDLSGNRALKPGRYMARAAISKINRMEAHVPGYAKFCRAHKLRPWSGVIESGIGWLVIPMPPAEDIAGFVREACTGAAPRMSACHILEVLMDQPYQSSRQVLTWWWQFPLDAPVTERADLDPKQMGALWAQLDGEVGPQAHKALWRMARAGDGAAKFIADRVTPVRADAGRVRQWIASLDDDKHAVRAKASDELSRLGRAAEPALRKALQAARSQEAKSRLTLLLDGISLPYPSTPSARRTARAVRILELIATPPAVDTLRNLAGGEANAPTTLQAKAALARVAKAQSHAPANRPAPEGASTTRRGSPQAARPGPPMSQPGGEGAAEARLERLWVALGSADPKEADKAAKEMAALGDRAVTFLTERFDPAPADAGELQQLIAKLDDEKYAARDKAYDDLMRFERAALPPLREALKAPGLSVEARIRIEKLVRTWTDPPAGTPQARQIEGAVQALAQIATPRAKVLLARLAEEGRFPWGDPVNGVRVRLRPQKVRWGQGEFPKFRVDVRNAGKEELYDNRGRSDIYELELDGQWYQHMAKVHKAWRPIGPGQTRDGILVDMAKAWGFDWPKEIGKLLGKPGKHVVRVAFNGTCGNPLRNANAKPVRVVSNAVKIEIAPAGTTRPAPTGTGVEGASTARRVSPQATRPRPPMSQPGGEGAAEAPLERLWVALGSADPKEAGKAVKDMAALKDQGVTFLTERLAPAPADGGQVNRLVAKLDDDKYAVRKKAHDELMRVGRAALPALREALKEAKLSTEARKRIEAVVADWTCPDPGTAQARRLEAAVEVLTRIASAKSKALLAGLATGNPEESLTTFALHPWGDAVEGVQSRARPDRRTWTAGEIPSFKLDVRNRGKRELQLDMFPENWRIEFDGDWYHMGVIRTGRAPRLPLGPWGEQRDIPFSPAAWGRWMSDKGRRALEFTPGKHVVRVSFTANPSGADGGGRVRAVSNPVEIEIQRPAAPGPKGEQGAGQLP